MTFTLIGMPGSGKSCMGRSLARKMNMKQVDGDRVIEEKYGMKLCDVLQKYGNEGFRKIEEEALCSIEGDGLVISTGGSAIYYPKAMEHLKSLGLVVYLYCDLSTIVARLGDFSKRGIVLAPGQTIADLYAERCDLYRKYADITVDCSGTAFPRYQSLVMRSLRYCAKENNN